MRKVYFRVGDYEGYILDSSECILINSGCLYPSIEKNITNGISSADLTRAVFPDAYDDDIKSSDSFASE